MITRQTIQSAALRLTNDDNQFRGYDNAESVIADAIKNETALLRQELTALRKELAEVTAAFQAECDHTFETEDHSFSHEFGTERIFVCRCTKCGKDAEPGDMPDPGEDGCDDGPRDAREEARLDP